MRKASKRACLWATAVVQVAGSLSQYHENIGCPAQNNRRLPPLAILTTGGTLGCLLQQFADLGDVISGLHQESFSRGWRTQCFFKWWPHSSRPAGADRRAYPICTSLRTRGRSPCILDTNLLVTSASIGAAILPRRFGCSDDQLSTARAKSASLRRRKKSETCRKSATDLNPFPYLLTCIFSWGSKDSERASGHRFAVAALRTEGTFFNLLQKLLLPSHSTLMTTSTSTPTSPSFFLIFVSLPFL